MKTSVTAAAAAMAITPLVGVEVGGMDHRTIRAGGEVVPKAECHRMNHERPREENEVVGDIVIAVATVSRYRGWTMVVVAVTPQSGVTMVQEEGAEGDQIMTHTCPAEGGAGEDTPPEAVEAHMATQVDTVLISTLPAMDPLEIGVDVVAASPEVAPVVDTGASRVATEMNIPTPAMAMKRTTTGLPPQELRMVTVVGAGEGPSIVAMNTEKEESRRELVKERGTTTPTMATLTRSLGAGVVVTWSTVNIAHHG